MSLIIPENISVEVRSLALQIDDRLEALEQEVLQSVAQEPMRRVIMPGTQQSGSYLPQFNYVNPVVNVVQFLDPLWQQLHANEIALREVRIDSIENVHLKANSVTARNLRADSVTADKIAVSELSAITADIGTITAGNLTIDSSGFVRGGATTYNSGTGFWLGYDTSAYKFFVGDSSGNKLLFDGTNLSLTGTITATSGTIGGFTLGTNSFVDSNDTMGFYTATNTTQVVMWAGQTLASRTTAAFRVYSDGQSVLTNCTLLTVNGNATVTGTMQFGSYTGTPLAIAGYVEIKDTTGTVRKLAVVS